MTRQQEKATFAGGCFWCMVKPFDQWDGVISVQSGYTGGQTKNPSYEEVKTGTTGHFEAVQITYEPEIISYQQILDVYWPQIDPTDDGGQYMDRGPQYRTAIFYHDNKQKQLAEASKKKLIDSDRFQAKIVTSVLPADVFYPAESYHQDFYKKQKEAYKQERIQSGRDAFIEKYWH
ncbi:peptide-methionine (S)-S-oxide reductase MsrA [Gracilibacillus phocaeensis]|uniref:peptide-methionine (S)-S-oxide reductase MsrA n=1 Tax=Gracilibacillus phocaeensis TaxID=2042304 RepID=UPI00102F6576|nr:peptide-methionine (S)-S-oxide reductase MsrA [Gracilibacillus phocaeensis]